MKKLLLLSALLCITFCSARAQLSSTITTAIHDKTFSQGRDFWLALPSNEWGENLGGKFIDLYISSTQKTTAYVEAGGTKTTLKIAPDTITTYQVPESLEMESSGIPKDQGIHVFDTDADLTVYFLSNDDHISEGSYVIPTIGWGTDYAVAAYGALFEGGGAAEYDEPSELTVVASEDNTEVDITPSCDCRQCDSGNVSGDAQAKIVVYQQGQAVQFPLNRGQSLQLMSVLATDPDNFDMTGTIIHANNPVGVIGASMAPNIPADYTYGNFVCEMIPPVNRWGKTYFGTNYQQPPNEPGKDFARYLFISSVPDQTIWGHSCEIGDFTEVSDMGPQYSPYWDERELGEKFWSDAPFLCVSYINSATYPDGVNGFGSPAEVTLNSREQFTNLITFQTADSGDAFVNIIYNIADAKNTIFDGKDIVGEPSTCVDDTFAIVNLEKIAPGAHTVTSDSGAGVYVYGYGADNSYAWSTSDGSAIFHSPDNIPPTADTLTQCYTTSVHVADSGLLQNPANAQTGLDAIWPGTVSNMTFQPDADWIEGSGADTSGYVTTVIDPTKPGSITVQMYDLAGNLTTITTTYKPDYALIEPPVQNLGVWVAGNPPNVAYDTLINEGQTTLDLTELQLKYGNLGFTIFDSIGGPLDLSPLAPGARRIIKILFEAVQSTTVFDSIIYAFPCEIEKSVAVIGNGGSDDFSVSNQTWPNEQLPAPLGGYEQSVTISNLSSVAISIDSARWTDTIHFKALTAFPISVPAFPGTMPFTIAYFPDSNSMLSYNRTQGKWYSAQVFESGVPVPRYDSLIGWAAAPSSVADVNNSTVTILPTNDGRSIEIILPENLNGAATFELVNVLGESILHESLGTGTQNIDASSLPRGVYFYRLTSGAMNQSGKVILGE